MSNTYSQIFIQIVFAVKGRRSLIPPKSQETVNKYISGIISTKGHKSIIVNGVSDHIHIFIGYKPSGSLSDLVREIKNNSSKYINENKLASSKFNWQTGYGAFSYSKSHIDNVYHYIQNQQAHHQKESFKSEYLNFLQKFAIEYEEKYLFDWLE